MAWEVACLIVDYFFYCRGRPGTEALLEELAEAHWSFMDGYAEAMIARGPTLTPDRTMWDFPAGLGDDRRFLAIGQGKPGVEAARQALGAAQRRWLGEPGHRDRFILRGPLLSDDGTEWLGSAMLVQLRDRAGVQAGLYTSVEVHDWQFGGRPQGEAA